MNIHSKLFDSSKAVQEGVEIILHFWNIPFLALLWCSIQMKRNGDNVIILIYKQCRKTFSSFVSTLFTFRMANFNVTSYGYRK